MTRINRRLTPASAAARRRRGRVRAVRAGRGSAAALPDLALRLLDALPTAGAPAGPGPAAGTGEPWGAQRAAAVWAAGDVLMLFEEALHAAADR